MLLWWVVVKWVYLVLDRGQWWTLENTIMNLCVPYNMRNIFRAGLRGGTARQLPRCHPERGPKTSQE
jgi:hypothetical protein